MGGEASELVVDEEEGGARLDAWLAARVAGLGRAGAREWVRSGAVRVDGRRVVVPSTRVISGQRVGFSEAPPLRDFRVSPEPAVDLDVRYDDSALLVVDKPSGVPCHPLRPDERGTLAGALVARYPELSELQPRREAGLVHRLDIGTSGLVVVARTQTALDELRRTLKAGSWEKRYLAVVIGVPDMGLVMQDALAPVPGDRRRMQVAPFGDARAHSARTEILAVTPAGEHSLVEVRADSARRHQVRVHLASAGHPLVGDALYGGELGERGGRLDHGLAHHALHASRIELPRPDGVGRVEVSSDLPGPLRALLDRLRRGARP